MPILIHFARVSLEYRETIQNENEGGVERTRPTYFGCYETLLQSMKCVIWSRRVIGMS
jgi:hypothetical protein